MTVATSLRANRIASGLSVTALAKLGATSKAAVSQIENEQRGVSVDRLESLLRLTRSRIVTISTIAQTPLEVALDLAQSLNEENTSRAFRQLVGFSAELLAEPAAVRVALCLTPPETTGAELYDAALAGVVDFALRGLPKPEWLNDSWRRVAEPVVLVEGSIHVAPARETVPIELLRRGVLIDAESLIGV